MTSIPAKPLDTTTIFTNPADDVPPHAESLKAAFNNATVMVEHNSPTDVLSPFTTDENDAASTSSMEPDSPHSRDPPVSRLPSGDDSPGQTSSEDLELDTQDQLQSRGSQPLVSILSGSANAMSSQRLSKLRRNVSWTDLATGDSLVDVVEYHPQEAPSTPPVRWDDTAQEPVVQTCACSIM